MRHNKHVKFMMRLRFLRPVSPSTRRCRRCRSRCRCCCRCPFCTCRRPRRSRLLRLFRRPRCRRLSWSSLDGRRCRRTPDDRFASAVRRWRWSARIGRPTASIRCYGGFSSASPGWPGTAKTNNEAALRCPVPDVRTPDASGGTLPMRDGTGQRNVATSAWVVPRLYGLCGFGVRTTAFPANDLTVRHATNPEINRPRLTIRTICGMMLYYNDIILCCFFF